VIAPDCYLHNCHLMKLLFFDLQKLNDVVSKNG
jgi:hypothetical protein